METHLHHFIFFTMPIGDFLTMSIGELSKPVTVLIEKVSEAIGGIAAPYQMKRLAKAEIEITDLHRRAAQRRIEEDALRQKNMEQILEKAVPQVNEDANPTEMDDDWIANFFDKSRLVSDSEMQNVMVQNPSW